MPDKSFETAAAEILARRREEVRHLHTFYVALNRRFALAPAAPELPRQPDSGDTADVERVEEWFGQVDGRAEAYQLRELLQTGFQLDGAGLAALVARHLRATATSDAHRDKLDFLLVQLLAQEIPPDTQDANHTGVAAVLQPILGDSRNFQWMDHLDGCVRQVSVCRSLREFMDLRLFDRGRELKMTAGPVYFTAPAMLAFTRFNFLVRRGFIRLLLADLKDIRDALVQLESAGVTVLDASSAGLSNSEPLKSIARLCKQWERPFQGKHSEQDWIYRVIEMRALVTAAASEARLTPPPPEAVVEPADKSALVPAPVATAAPAVIAGPARMAEFAVVPQPADVEPPLAEPVPPQIAVKLAGERAATPAPTAAPKPATVTAASEPVTALTKPAKTPATAVSKPVPASQVPAATPAGVPDAPDVVLDTLPAQIAVQLESARPGKSAAVTVGEAKVSLASWEVAAFMDTANVSAAAVQRAVALRAMLSAVKPQKAVLLAWLEAGNAEITSLREQAAAARQSGDTDAAMALSMSARSLVTAVEQAQKRAR